MPGRPRGRGAARTPPQRRVRSRRTSSAGGWGRAIEAVARGLVADGDDRGEVEARDPNPGPGSAGGVAGEAGGLHGQVPGARGGGEPGPAHDAAGEGRGRDG